MQTDNDTPKRPVSFYGKKIYYINPLLAKKVVPAKKAPEYASEEIEEDQDK